MSESGSMSGAAIEALIDEKLKPIVSELKDCKRKEIEILSYVDGVSDSRKTPMGPKSLLICMEGASLERTSPPARDQRILRDQARPDGGRWLHRRLHAPARGEVCPAHSTRLGAERLWLHSFGPLAQG